MNLKLPRWRPPGGLRPWVAGISLLLVLLALWSHGQEVLALAPDQRGWALLILGLALTVVAQWANGLAWENPGCDQRVVRGGNWAGAPKQARSAARLFAENDLRGPIVGFRIARDL